MLFTRRTFLGTASAAGTMTLLPFAARAEAHAFDTFETPAGPITIHPIAHASFVMETPIGTIYVDPTGEGARYADLPPADLILVTHHHGDHYKPETLVAVKTDTTQMLTNPTVFEMLDEELKSNTSMLANGKSALFKTLSVDAIPAYNTTEARLNFHPQGRDNGYVLSFDGFRVYISGDTEDIPEMRALENIDLAFVCMNLPFTMDVRAAASAVTEFQPGFVYPYHYRGRDDGTQNPAEFARLVGDASEVRLARWYGNA